MWVYEQSTGSMRDASGKLLASGYSGFGIAKNDPAAQEIPNQGPIPQGEYLIMPPQDSLTHGPFAMRLYPEADNEMYGRSGFMIHGDSLEHPGAASDGCIILTRTARETIWSSGDHQLQVVSGLVIEQGDDEEAGTA